MAGPKHGGGGRRQELDDACAILKPPSADVLAVHEALDELEASEPLEAQIVLLRYFTGLTWTRRRRCWESRPARWIGSGGISGRG